MNQKNNSPKKPSKKILGSILILTSVVVLVVTAVVRQDPRFSCGRQSSNGTRAKSTEIVNFDVPISSIVIDDTNKNLVAVSRNSSKLYVMALLGDGERSIDADSRVADVIDTDFSGFSELAVHESSEYLTAGTLKGRTVVWKADNNSVTGWNSQGEVLAGTHGGFVTSVSISDDGKFITSSGGDSIFVWERNDNGGDGASSWSLIANEYGAHSGPTVWDVVFGGKSFWSQEKLSLISVGNDSRVRRWNLTTNGASSSLLEQANYNARRQINSVLFDSRTASVFLGLNNGLINVLSEGVFEDNTSKENKEIERFPESHAQQPITDFSAPKNLDILVTSSNDETVKTWSICKQELSSTFREHSDWVNTVDISQYGKYIVSGGEDKNVVIRTMN